MRYEEEEEKKVRGLKDGEELEQRPEPSVSSTKQFGQSLPLLSPLTHGVYHLHQLEHKSHDGIISCWRDRWMGRTGVNSSMERCMEA